MFNFSWKTLMDSALLFLSYFIIKHIKLNDLKLQTKKIYFYFSRFNSDGQSQRYHSIERWKWDFAVELCSSWSFQDHSWEAFLLLRWLPTTNRHCKFYKKKTLKLKNNLSVLLDLVWYKNLAQRISVCKNTVKCIKLKQKTAKYYNTSY